MVGVLYILLHRGHFIEKETSYLDLVCSLTYFHTYILHGDIDTVYYINHIYSLHIVSLSLIYIYSLCTHMRINKRGIR